MQYWLPKYIFTPRPAAEGGGVKPVLTEEDADKIRKRVHSSGTRWAE